MKKFLHLFIMAALVFAVSCKKEDVVVVVTGISVTPSSINIKEGESATLTATVTPSNAANQRVEWSSSNDDIALVSDGKVIGRSVGSAKITVRSVDGGKSATCSVTVVSKSDPTSPEDGSSDPTSPEDGSSDPTSPEDGPTFESTNVELSYTPFDYETLTVDVAKGEEVIVAEQLPYWIRTKMTEDGFAITTCPNYEAKAREFELTLSYKGYESQTCKISVTQESNSEREALYEIWEKLSGGQDWGWKEPAGQSWEGAEHFSLSNDLQNWVSWVNGHVEIFWIMNGAKGQVPASIGAFKKMKRLILMAEGLSGTLPEEIGEIEDLDDFGIFDTEIGGQIGPRAASALAKALDKADRTSCLTRYLILSNNRFTGTFPEALWKSPGFAYSCGWEQQEGYGFDPSSYYLSMPTDIIMDIYGKELDLGKKIKDSKYTVFLHCDINKEEDKKILDHLKNAYEQYHETGLEIVCYAIKESTDISDLELQGYDAWPSFFIDDCYGLIRAYPLKTPAATVVDNENRVVFTWECPQNGEKDSRYKRDTDTQFIPFLEGKFGKIQAPDERVYYQSKDYSRDGKVVQLQKATVGNGIDIVIMGDAYADKDIKEGKFETAAKAAYDAFFEKEPYKSFKNRFNVYAVDAVSKNNEYSSKTTTALEVQFGGSASMWVGGNDTKVKSYMAKAISSARIDKAVAIVLLNTRRNCGTAFWDENYPDQGICYLPANRGESAKILQHEACGHAFGKLQDEYWYEGEEATQGMIDYVRKVQKAYEWNMNVDFTSNTKSILWARFIADSRYAGENLGAYEGACTVQYGAYRPTESSIMVRNIGEFNAPSREAIYKRINRLADPSWTYDYETFVKYDAVNRNYSKTKSGWSVIKPQDEDAPRHVSPVIKRK